MKLTSPIFLQAASAHKRGVDGLIMRFDIADPSLPFAFMNPLDLSVTTTKNGVTTTTEYQGVQVVSVEADAATDIIVKGDFTGNNLFAPYFNEVEDPHCTKVHVNASGLAGLYLYASIAEDVKVINTESLSEFERLSSVITEFDCSPYANVDRFALGCDNIASIDLSPLAGVDDIELWLSAVTDLDVSMLEALQVLRINAPVVTNLDFSHNNNLTLLEIADCVNLTSVTLGTNANMIELGIEGSPSLAAPDISGLTGLTTLGLQRMDALTGVDLSHNTQLESLSIGENSNLTGIDLSQNTALKKLDADDCTALTALDLTPCPNLEWLYLRNPTSLVTLDLSMCTYQSLQFQGTNLPAAQVVKTRAISQYLAMNLGGAIDQPQTAAGGTLYLNSADTYYLSMKQKAEQKGWTVASL